MDNSIEWQLVTVLFSCNPVIYYLAPLRMTFSDSRTSVQLLFIFKSNVVSNEYVLFNYLDIRILAQTCNTANSLGRRQLLSSSSSVRQHTVAGCSSFQTGRPPPLSGGCRQSVERSIVDDRGFNVTRCLYVQCELDTLLCRSMVSANSPPFTCECTPCDVVKCPCNVFMLSVTTINPFLTTVGLIIILNECS